MTHQLPLRLLREQLFLLSFVAGARRITSYWWLLGLLLTSVGWGQCFTTTTPLANRTLPVGINPAPAVVPLSLTATVGTPFTYSLPMALIPSTNVTYTATGLPANGLTFDADIPPTISGTPITAGLLSVTITATPNSYEILGPSVSAVYLITINPPPGTLPTNHPPVAPSIPSQTATVGVAYVQNTPSFTDPDGQAIAVEALGLPPGLSYTGTASGSVAGTPTLAGLYSVSLVGTDLSTGTLAGGLSATAVYAITVAPAPPSGGSLELLAPTYSCTTGAFTFNTSGGEGSPITFAAIGITGPTTNPNQFVDAELRTTPDAPLITLHARQNGVAVSYEWNIRAVCPVGGSLPPNQAPGLLVPLADQTARVGQAFSYPIPDNTFVDPDGDALSYSASGLPPGLSLSGTTLRGVPTQAGVSRVTLTATDRGGLFSSSVFGLRVQLAATEPPVDFAITGASLLSCEATGPGERQVRLSPQYSGQNGQAITFSVANELPATTAAGPYTLRLYTDNPLITLTARQAGTAGEAQFSYNWLAVCGPGARQGATESVHNLQVVQVVVLANPVLGETVELAVRGAEGRPLLVRLVDSQGRLVGQHQWASAQAVERLHFAVGSQPAGLLLLQVSTPTQQRTVKVLKR